MVVGVPVGLNYFREERAIEVVKDNRGRGPSPPSFEDAGQAMGNTGRDLSSHGKNPICQQGGSKAASRDPLACGVRRANVGSAC